MSEPAVAAGPRARLGVDLAAAFDLVGSCIKYLGVPALIPAVFAVAHSEPAWPFLVAGATVTLLGFGLERITRGAPEVGVREAYLVVVLAWLFAGLYGALPYVLAGDEQLGRPVDAMFEGMSGFTTTGASAATDPSSLPVSIQVWRQLTAWLGGIGVVALGLAVLPRLRIGGRQLLESELAGASVESVSGRIRDTVRRFWLLYLGLSGACFLALVLPGWVGFDDTMGTYQAFAHTLTTIPTAGFSTETSSIGAFGGLTQWTVVVFMAIAGTNYLLLYRAIVQRRPHDVPRDEEWRLFVLVLLAASATVAVILWEAGVDSGEAAIRAAAFEVTTVVTTTGYTATNYDTWPTFGLMALALLMFTGACAGSTTGSIKMVRHLLLARLLRREVIRTVHPELVHPVRLHGTIVDQQTLLAVISFVLIYVAVFVLGAGVIALESSFHGPDLAPLDIVYASAATLGNVGVGLGVAGAQGSFGAFGDVSTVTMTALMWIGRLEIIPVVVLLHRGYWRV